MIYDDLGEYFTDPCRHICFVEIWVESTSNFKIIHWDLRYNAYQHPCDLMVNPLMTTKRTTKMKHWEMCIHNLLHNFCSKESTIFRQHIFFNNFFFLRHWTHGNKVRRKMQTFWLKKLYLKMSQVCKMTAILSRPHFSDYIWHLQWNQVTCHKVS